ncbi:MAG TPA: hypothetical protein IGS52_04235 [Oscillatoriaceae cyanobacterium M33_DOE_052]|nr:hypothetical protein [Oscillatoriaceae cyanobacterium M33_DOE_052]
MRDVQIISEQAVNGEKPNPVRHWRREWAQNAGAKSGGSRTELNVKLRSPQNWNPLQGWK